MIRLPSYEQCEHEVKFGEPTALELFIYNNEPAGVIDEEQWRTSLANVLAENRSEVDDKDEMIR